MNLEVGLDEILSNTLSIPVGDISPDLSHENCTHWDSLNYLLIILGLEEKYSIKFSIAEIESSTSRSGLIETLQSKLD